MTTYQNVLKKRGCYTALCFFVAILLFSFKNGINFDFTKISKDKKRGQF